MSSLVSLLLCMSLIYLLSYLDIPYNVVLEYIGNMFLCSSPIHDLEARVLREHNPFDLVS
jgi:hypothetical protein